MTFFLVDCVVIPLHDVFCHKDELMLRAFVDREIIFGFYLTLTEEVGDEGEEEKECITYNVSIDIHYGLKSNR